MGFIAAAAPQGNGLGDYFDGQHTWHYDAAAGYYVDETGAPNQADPIVQQQQTTQQTTAPEPANWDALVGQYGSTPNAQGGYTYTAAANPYLQTNPTNTGSAGVTQGMNPDFYATLEAAKQFAAVLGGTVVLDPQLQIGGSGSPIYAVRLPDGTTANAGAIGMILGNDAAYGNIDVKSGEIAKLFGASYDPAIATALATGEGSITLLPGMPAPGYNVTPLSQKAVSAAAAASSSNTTTKATTPPAPPPSPTTTTGSPLGPGLKVINDQLTSFADQAKEKAQSLFGDKWALWLLIAAVVAAYLMRQKENAR